MPAAVTGCFPNELATRLGHRFCAILERYDAAAMRELLTPDVTLWQNFSTSELHGEQVFAFLSNAFPTLPMIQYRDIRCTPTASGWAQQHVIDCDTLDNRQVRGLHCCLLITAEGDRIARVEEYLDRSHAVKG